MSRSLLMVILGMGLLACRGWAQDDDFSATTSALQDVLSNLKQSVERLSLDNDQLTARDNAVKTQVLQLQTQLGELESQGDVLNQAAAKLQVKDPGRAQQIARMEEETFDMDIHTQKSEASIKLLQQSLDTKYQEEEKALAPQSPDEVHRQNEKLKLMQMINESQQRQELISESILGYQKTTPLPPAAGALAHQQSLKEQIRDLEAQIAAYPPEGPSDGPGLGEQWDVTQLGQLESELTSMEHNYSQLKDLMGQMNKNPASTQMTVSERIEEKKLQANIEDLKHQGVRLKAELDDLRSQMVDLDKRKSSLEVMIQQMH